MNVGLLEKIGKILDSVFASLGLEKKFEENRILARWDEAVGSSIAGHAFPIRIQNKKLFVATDSASWRNELTFLRQDIIKKLNSMAGRIVIEEIVFVAGVGDKSRE